MAKPDIRFDPICRRCLTLLETLVALAILIAAGAFVFPMMMSSLDERAFESVADVTNEQLMLARAHAQATGSPVEVTFNRATSQVQARLYLPWQSPEAGNAAAPFSAFPGIGATGSDDRSTATLVERQPEVATRDIPASWACQTLGPKVRFRTSAPPASVSDADRNLSEPSLGEDDFESLADLASGQEVRLAVFMPDGSALAGEPVWLNDEDGRCGLFTINPWSGLPVFQRVERSPTTNTDAELTNDAEQAVRKSDRESFADERVEDEDVSDTADDDEQGPFNF